MPAVKFELSSSCQKYSQLVWGAVCPDMLLPSGEKLN